MNSLTKSNHSLCLYLSSRFFIEIQIKDDEHINNKNMTWQKKEIENRIQWRARSGITKTVNKNGKYVKTLMNDYERMRS